MNPQTPYDDDEGWETQSDDDSGEIEASAYGDATDNALKQIPVTAMASKVTDDGDKLPNDVVSWFESIGLGGDSPNLKGNELNNNGPLSDLTNGTSGPPKKKENGTTKLKETPSADAGPEGGKFGRCSHCGKKAIVKTCARCGDATYCDRACQKADFKVHKDKCKDKARLTRFKDVMKRFPPTNLFNGPPGIPYGPIDESNEVCQDDYGNYFLYPVLVEITEPWFHPFRISVQIQDINGKTGFMVFYCDSKVFMKMPPGGKKGKRKGKGKAESKAIPIEECVKPGNFVVLKDPQWHHFMDGSQGYRIDDLEDVDFLFP